MRARVYPYVHDTCMYVCMCVRVCIENSFNQNISHKKSL